MSNSSATQTRKTTLFGETAQRIGIAHLIIAAAGGAKVYGDQERVVKIRKDVSPASVRLMRVLGLVTANSFCCSTRSGLVAKDNVALIEEQNCKREAYLGL
eukprot:762855_1